LRSPQWKHKKAAGGSAFCQNKVII